MFSKFEKRIGYTFKNKTYLKNALCHSSYANEHRLGHFGCNERLEFLGDSILGFLTARYLYENFPDKPEGELTKLRAAHVCETALFSYARQIELGEVLLLGRGEEMGGGRERPSVLSDAFEALLAAMYLDGGLGVVEEFLLPFIKEHLAEDSVDHKTALQEFVQQTPGKEIRYVLKDSLGPDHEKKFFVSVLLNQNEIAEGQGKSKKEAEQMAAQNALLKLKKYEAR